MAARDGNGHQSGLGEGGRPAGHRDSILGGGEGGAVEHGQTGWKATAAPHRRFSRHPTSPGERSANQTPARRKPPPAHVHCNRFPKFRMLAEGPIV